MHHHSCIAYPCKIHIKYTNKQQSLGRKDVGTAFPMIKALHLDRNDELSWAYLWDFMDSNTP